MNHRNHVLPGTLADHAEGLLGEFAAGLVSAHLTECAECRFNDSLLVSLRGLLHADDPGPMPARYAVRIGARLAELAIAEPVLPAQAAARVAGAAHVLELAPRRIVLVGAVHRLGTVAAGVAVLLTGAALGAHTISSRSGVDRPSALGAPSASVPPTILFAAFPTAPPGSTDGPHGSKEGPDHWIYTKDKVFLPWGDVLVRPRTPGAPPVVISPGHRPAAASTPRAGKGTGTQPTVIGPQAPGAGQRPNAPTIAATPPTPAANQPTPSAATAQPSPPAGAVRTAAADPYVSESGTAYTEDNFATKVMDLVRAAEADHRPATSDAGESSSAAQQSQADPQDDPAAPANGPQPDAEVRTRVMRCAAQIPRAAIAGDEGTWLDRPATIVVVPSDRPDQVVGYVFYGTCTKKGPATASDYQWKQQVTNPTPEPGQGATSPARVDDVTGAGESQRDTVPVDGAAPTPAASPGSTRGAEDLATN
jgi:hypothetical protein